MMTTPTISKDDKCLSEQPVSSPSVTLPVDTAAPLPKKNNDIIN